MRLKLLKVVEVISGIKKNPYVIGYKDRNQYRLPPRFSFSQDYWGYFNGKFNASLVPKYRHETIDGRQIDIGNADRNVYLDYPKSGVIEKIVYPSLGFTVFDFENNTATIFEGTIPKQYLVGGLRVKSIANFDFDNVLLSKKTYEYKQKSNLNLSSGIYNGTDYIKPRDFFFSTPFLYPSENICHIVGPTDVQTFTERVSSSPTVSNNLAPVFYSSVKEYNGTLENYQGYKWYHYAIYKDKFYSGSGPISFKIDRSWKRGQLLLEETYKKGSFTPIKTVSNNYEIQIIREPILGFKPGTRLNVSSLGYYPNVI